MTRRDWKTIVEAAEGIVREANARGVGLSLRGLFYRCVVARLFDNSVASYKGLSEHTTLARDDPDRKPPFPDLVDDT